jgi:hypothetical protein
MATSKALTVEEYLAELPPDRRAALGAVREVILANLPPGFEEGMSFGMIGYCVPLSRYPDTYNGQPLGIAALAAQKGYMSLYLMCVYGDPETKRWFEAAFRQAGKRLDMGKSCVRWKSPDDLPLEVIGQAIARVSVDAFIARYEASRAPRPRKPAARRAPPRKPAARKPAARKPVSPRRPPRKRA